MSHHIYHTRGIILGSTPSGESNRYYKIFTEELGLVGAVAQSVREGKSKLRYVLQDYSLIHIDLVRGKEVWRITSAIEEQSKDFIGGEAQKKLFARACAFNMRLLQGEGKEKKLFADLHALAEFLKNQELPESLYFSFETLASLRVLSQLGYADAELYRRFLKSSVYTREIIEEFTTVLPGVSRLVNTGLVSSHL